MNTVTIEVKKKHLDTAAKAGDKASTLNCLLAQAIREAFPKKYVQVGYTTAQVGNGSRRKSFDLPKKAQRLIDRFDRYAFSEFASDKRKLATLRASLPTSFTMTEEEEGV